MTELQVITHQERMSVLVFKKTNPLCGWLKSVKKNHRLLDFVDPTLDVEVERLTKGK